MSKRWTYILAVVIIAIAAGWFLRPSNPDVSPSGDKSAKTATGVLVDNRMPEFKLAALDGKQISVGAPGKITVVNFWATWCPPCRAEMPELNEFARKHAAKVNFYAVNIQEPADKVGDFMKQQNFTMPVLLDKEGEVARTFRVSAIPTTIITDKQGVIRYRKSGTVTLSELEGVINGL
ncbi:MAG: TlpA family protein disulfide reductase [Negativicutes bacterium]|nr:TlpA family protein disulfide reductase [Negativicutes bacterium]